jgi:hypothetical protein
MDDMDDIIGNTITDMTSVMYSQSILLNSVLPRQNPISHISLISPRNEDPKPVKCPNCQGFERRKMTLSTILLKCNHCSGEIGFLDIDNISLVSSRSGSRNHIICS